MDEISLKWQHIVTQPKNNYIMYVITLNTAMVAHFSNKIEICLPRDNIRCFQYEGSLTDQPKIVQRLSEWVDKMRMTYKYEQLHFNNIVITIQIYSIFFFSSINCVDSISASAYTFIPFIGIGVKLGEFTILRLKNCLTVSFYQSAVNAFELAANCT